MGSFQELSLRRAANCESSLAAHPPEAAMQSDFRNSLQQLAERAQYITRASGIAIALREPGSTQMTCEASSGRTAPGVGDRLHVESGITAECVRTKKILRCDHASSDPRVNAESCRALRVESVLVLPLTVGGFVVGILELFGEEPAAFQERDVDTLEHVGEMVQKLVLQRMQASFATDHPRQQTSIGSEDDLLPTADGTREEETGSPEETPLPAFLARLVDEAEEPRQRHWGAWLLQGRR